MVQFIEGFQLSIHAKTVIQERELSPDWIKDTILDPDIKEVGSDGNLHYIKSIAEFNDHKLRVVVNDKKVPPKIVTIFFDRRLRTQK